MLKIPKNPQILNRLYNVFILLFVFILTSNVCAQSTNYRFHTFSPKGGFFYDGVKDIAQDAQGFIWVLFENDILRFDGYEFKNYYSAFSDVNTSTKLHFQNFAINSKGEVYLATSTGLYVYNRYQENFKAIYSGYLNNVYIDRDDNIWVTNGDKHFYYLDVSNKSLNPLNYESKPARFIIHVDTNGEDLYMATMYDRIYYCDYKKDIATATLFYKFPNTYIIRAIRRSDGKIWAATLKHGLFKIDIATQQIEEHFDLSYNNEPISVRTMYIDKNNTVWIGAHQGLFVLNSQIGKFDIYQHSKYNEFSIPNNSVWKIKGDNQQNIWIGTYSGGLCYVNLDETTWVKSYSVDDNQLNNGLVSSFAEGDNYLWVGTEGGGLHQFNKVSGKVTYRIHDERRNSLISNNVKSMVLDHESNLWIATYRGGLDCYNINQNKFYNYKKDWSDERSLFHNDLRRIILDRDSGLWVAYQYGGLNISYFSFKEKKFTHYSSIDNVREFILDMQKDSDGNVWFITRENLYKFDINKKEIISAFRDTTKILNGQTLYIQENNIWIGTKGNGLLNYNMSDEKLITVFPELINQVTAIYSICSDVNGNLWLGTDNGLIRYSPQENNYYRFSGEDGLQGLNYYPLASMRDESGMLYFGGTNGFSVVYPEKIPLNTYQPHVIISDFYIDNVSANPKLFLDQEKGIRQITLTYKEANFGFKFASDNYLLPSKNRFKYRLKGYDDRWITTNAGERVVLYSKVPSGNYEFEVVAANNDGIWSDNITTIEIVRKPAPWLTWQAYLIYTILIAIFLGFVIHYFTERRKMKLQLYIDNLDKQNKEEIHQSQLRFFTNISHDFRTPLSLILATIDNMKNDGLKDYYYRILHNNATRLKNLVNEVMDFKTIENGRMQLKVETVNLNLFVEELALDFVDLARKRDFKYFIELDPKLSQETNIYVDKQVLEKIIMNLLNNSFKYTDDGGDISFETYSDRSAFKSKYDVSYRVCNNVKYDKSFLIVIRDTGIGITKESISSVFERFYKVKTVNVDRHLGTGIGLALVKSLVLLHKGEITIYSERNSGTDIVVELPCGLNPYKEDQNVFIENSKSDSDLLDYDEDSGVEMLGDKLAPEPDDLLLNTKKRILIVEDNEDLRLLLLSYLSKYYDVRGASNGQEAIDILNESELDLIISDLMMPIKDGTALLKEVKNNIETSHIPIILLTAKTELEAKLENVELGADMYFEKPIDLKLLQLSIQNIFNQRQKIKEYYSKNYYVDTDELSTNERDNQFLKQFVKIIDDNIDNNNIDINLVASELAMSRSKLYSKVKIMTDKSIVEFILQYRLRKAAKILIEDNLPVYIAMEKVGIRSQSYFTKAFKNEFGLTPTAFVQKNKTRL